MRKHSYSACACAALLLAALLLPGAAQAATLADRVRGEDAQVYYYSEKYTDLQKLVDYVLPVSKDKTLTEADIANLTPAQLSLARNEILARHGFVFQTQTYKEFFAQRAWYRPNAKFDYNMLSKTENKNIDFLKRWEAIQQQGNKKYTSTQRLDLNGDGKVERVSATADRGNEKITLSVENASVSLLGSYLKSEFYVFDLDTRDKYKEVALLDYGPSDDPEVTFFRYDGKKLINMGTVYSYPSNMLLDGKGGLRARIRGEILFTWYGMRAFAVTGNAIKPVKQSDSYMNTLAVMEKSLTVQKSKSSTTTAFTLRRGDVVLLRRTDDSRFIELVNEKGQVGWMRYRGYEDGAYFYGLPMYD